MSIYAASSHAAARRPKCLTQIAAEIVLGLVCSVRGLAYGPRCLS